MLVLQNTRKHCNEVEHSLEMTQQSNVEIHQYLDPV